jgi:hypothetical protein
MRVCNEPPQDNITWPFEIQLLISVQPAASGWASTMTGSTYKKGMLYAKGIRSLPDALFSSPQSEEQCCELDRSTALFGIRKPSRILGARLSRFYTVGPFGRKRGPRQARP